MFFLSLQLEDWEVNRAMVFSGYTHTATAMEDEETGVRLEIFFIRIWVFFSLQEEVIYYSHPFEFEIFYTPSEESPDQGKSKVSFTLRRFDKTRTIELRQFYWSIVDKTEKKIDSIKNSDDSL